MIFDSFFNIKFLDPAYSLEAFHFLQKNVLLYIVCWPRLDK
jgi:hypothetical protein